jgi:hypothetical protein
MRKLLAVLLLAICAEPGLANPRDQPVVQVSLRFSDQNGVGYELREIETELKRPSVDSGLRRTLFINCVKGCINGNNYTEDMVDYGITGVLMDQGDNPRVLTTGDNGHHYMARVYSCRAGSCQKIFDEMSTSIPMFTPNDDGLMQITIGSTSWVHNDLITHFQTWAWDGKHYAPVQSKPKSAR